jgi:putative transcriptional regulator
MATRTDYDKLSVFEQIKQGLQDSIAHARGQLSLRTVELPAPPPSASPKQVRALRRRLRMSQSVFAATLNVSPKLVQSWEQGARQPGRGDLRLIQIIERDPKLVDALFGSARGRRARSSAA